MKKNKTIMLRLAALALMMASCDFKAATTISAGSSNDGGAIAESSSSIVKDGTIYSIDGATLNEESMSAFMLVEPGTKSVPLSDKVKVSSNTTWKLYRGESEIATKIATTKSGSLVDGDNIFYLVVSFGTTERTYELNIYRSFYVTITYMLNEKRIGTDTARTGYEFVLPDSYDIEGHAFSYWMDRDNNKITSITPYQNETVYAYAPGHSCLVTLNPAGGELNETSIAVVYDDQYSLPTPTRPNYDFAGWYDDSCSRRFPSSGVWTWDLGSEITLTAHWSIVYYSIIYVLNGGTNAASNPSLYTVNDEVTFSDPTRECAAFLGWYDINGNKIERIPAGSAGNLTLYARWDLDDFAIIYHLNGGENAESNPSSYTIEDSFAFSSPTREGYEFDGWYDAAGNRVTGISLGSKGIVEIYADWVQDYLSFTDLGDGWEVIKNSRVSCPGVVEIPNFYRGKAVISIGEKGFYDNRKILSITIPDSVTSIGDYAFSGCSSLASIVIPDSVTSIGENAFQYCSSLAPIVIPDSVTSIGPGAFSHCTSLTSVEIPDSVSSIESYAFYDCTSLASVLIPDSVASIGSFAFSGCTSLTSVEIPDSVASIGNHAFWCCSSLASIVIPDSVTSIGKYAFSGCSSLASIVIPDSVTSIGDSAFSSCGSLRAVFYGGSLTEWNAVQKPWITADIVYFYSELEPSKSGNYWHYVDGVPTIWENNQ